MKTDHELASRLMDSALSRGAYLAEVYQRASSSLSTDVKNGEVEAASRSRTFGYGLRIIKDGRPGFSFSNDPGDAEVVVQRALDVSAYASSDDSLGLPEELDSPEVDAFDMEVDAISEARARELAVQVEEGARESDPRIKKVRKASSSFSSSQVLIMNSRGLSKGFSTTSCAASIMCVAEEGDDSQTGWGFESGRYLGEVDFRGAGTDSARRATQMLGARRVQGGRFHLLLDPSVSAEFLAVFSSMLSAESVQKGRSLLKGRVGEKVIHGALTIIDNGLLPDGPGRRPVDD
ncbi:MAG: TldD/PmbA family protein, partial [Thermodesulfovibrionales bacterium]|nr:TldD/PmbA family protein [Thermodesulfovibrionales bacterium]